MIGRKPRGSALNDFSAANVNGTGDKLEAIGDHLAFGAGPHACVGMHVALMEMRALFTEMVKHVRRFEIVEEERALNSVLRMHRRLVVRVS